jgi:exonuclease SbcC
VKIELVQLENIRSHVKSTVPFAKGFNCLVGGVGCGKSSILYSIDFALFGDPIGRSYEYLLREDTENGKVTIQFAQDGKTYKIVRGLKRRGKGIGQDPDELKLLEGDDVISSVKSEAIAEQLKAITGMDRDLFRELVWVRQEHLKELLDVAPRERQKRLDEMFGLSDYEVAWSNLAGYQREYELERKVYEKDPDVAGMERLNAEYSKTVEDFSLVEIDLQDIAKKLGASKKTLEEAESALKKLEEVRTRNEELRRKEARLLADLTNLSDDLASAAEKIDSKKAAIESLKQRLKTMEAQAESYRMELKTNGLSLDESDEMMRQQIVMLEDKISDLKAGQEATLRNTQTDQKRISSLSNESRCPLCLQSLTEEYKNDLVRRFQEENNERKDTMEQLQREIEEMQKNRNKANTVFSNLQLLVPRMEDMKNRIHEECQSLNGLAKESEVKQGQETEVRKQFEELHVEISRFDVLQLDEAKRRKDEASRQCYSLDSDLRLKESRRKDLTKRLDEIKERIDHAQQKIERMERIVKITGVISGIRDAYRSIQPKLRTDFVKVLQNFVQQVLDGLIGGEGPILNAIVDETYTPYVKSESGVEREVSNLSGGERTLLAFAYRLGLGQLIMQSKTGHGLSIVLLDEPTESLGREDGSIDRLAEAISRFKAIEQIIAVTHSEAFAEKAEHVIRLEKEANESRVSVER